MLQTAEVDPKVKNIPRLSGQETTRTMAIIGETLLKQIIGKLAAVGFDYLADQYRWHTGIKAELQRLNDALPRILAVVHAAEAEPELLRENPNLRAWLWQLKDAAYEADDVLDELDYLRLQKQVEEAKAKDQESQNLKVRVSNSLAHSKNKAVEFCKRVCNYDPTLNKLRAVVEKMDGIAAHVGDFLAIVNTVQQHHQLYQAQVVNNRETGPLLPGGSSVVFGRDTEREELVQWLMKPSDEDGENNIALFSVVGAGGMGKTTLSQLVFNDERVQKFFNLRIWVCVSTNFNARRLLAAVLESATKERPNVDSLSALQMALEEKLVSSGKFLLVLDDAWNDNNMSSWNNLLAPLKCGEKGSKILLTTRSDRVAEKAAQAATGGRKKVMKLARLEDHVFIPLFYQYAFAAAKSDDYGKLQSIGKKIARRLGGSPLAAKSIGSLLNSNLNDVHWTNILFSNILHAQQQADQDNINSILMLSYHHLPTHLRSCFAFCSIFPQDYLIHRKTLIRMWVGVGLIQRSPQNQNQTDEDIGGYYFDDLLKRSFFEPYRSDDVFYTIHDLLHELAQSVSQDECLRVVDDTSIQGIPTMVRHLWIEIDNPNLLAEVDKWTDKWKNLRTLVLICKEYNHHEHSTIFSELFKSLKSIRVLHLLVRGMKELANEIGYLIHLRVLSTYPPFTPFSSSIIRLPGLICKLYHLQFIELRPDSGSDGIPQGMNNLISLKCMMPKDVLDMIDGIGKLISLHELVFSIEEKSGRRIEELKDLNNLHELRIKGVENVKSHKEASMAELHNKGQLLKLELEWGRRCSPDELIEHEEILDCLRPHSNLKELRITGYRGGRHAKWMEYEFINNLEKIILLDLLRLECLPCLGKLPYLKFLCLRNMPKVKQLDCEGGFPRLEVLGIFGLNELEEWSGLVENLVQWCPRLRNISIKNCPGLKVLPSLPLGLTKLELLCVGVTTLPSFWPASNNDRRCSNCSSTESSSSSLCSVKIMNCEQLTSLAKGLLQHHLPALEHLDICNCKELVDLPTEGLQHLSSLKTLKIEECPNLQQPADDFFLPCLGKGPYLEDLCLKNIPKVKQLDCEGSFPGLKELRIYKLNELEEWAGLVENLAPWCPRLQKLTLCYCPGLKVLPSLPLTLTHLELRDVGLTALPSFWPASNNDGNCSNSSSTESSSSSLCSVEIKYCKQLTSLARGLLQHHLPALEYLYICNCKELVDLPTEGLQHLSSLKTLKIEECPKLQPAVTIIPANDCSLALSPQELHIRNCGDLGQIISYIAAGSTSLQKLVIEECEELISLESLVALHHLDCLAVSKCPKLVQTTAAPSIKGESFTLTINMLIVDDPSLLLTEPLRNLTSVHNLEIKNCRRLDTLAGKLEAWLLQNSSLLESVVLRRAVSLQSLPPSIRALYSLKYLRLEDPDKLPSLPQLPLSLERLIIRGCNDTLKERCQKDDGADWPNIRHIPRIYKD